jgi:hypothetical protein
MYTAPQQQLKAADRVDVPPAAAVKPKNARKTAAVKRRSAGQSADAPAAALTDTAVESASATSPLDAVQQLSVRWYAADFIDHFLHWQKRRAQQSENPVVTVNGTVLELGKWIRCNKRDAMRQPIVTHIRHMLLGYLKQSELDMAVASSSASVQTDEYLLTSWIDEVTQRSYDARRELQQVNAVISYTNFLY